METQKQPTLANILNLNYLPSETEKLHHQGYIGTNWSILTRSYQGKICTDIQTHLDQSNNFCPDFC